MLKLCQVTKRNPRRYGFARRLNASIYGGTKDPIKNKNYPPGMHGPTLGYRKLTDYGQQLHAKQKLKKHYGDAMNEGQFRRYCLKARSMKGNAAHNLVALLESRLDAVVYRAQLAPTPFAARQLINHKHIRVNGRCVNIPSFKLKPGDVVEIKEASKKIPLIHNSFSSKNRRIPDYISVDLDKVSITYLRPPTDKEEVPYPVEMSIKLVLEYYSQ